MKLTLPIPPALNKLYRTDGRGGFYKAPFAKTWLTEVRWHLISQRPVTLTGPVSLSLAFFFASERRDIDSGLKALLDALNGYCYLDDGQIVELHVTKQVDKKNPRVEVEVHAVSPH